jgi:uncharacterized iron-regulated membrane protein
MAVATEQNALYRAFWRWHFYAALFVIPLVLLLSVTGSAYLFKPQLDRLQQSMLVEQARSELVPAGTLDPDLQLSKVMSAYPGWQFQYYQLPEQVGDPAILRIANPETRERVDVLVANDGEIIGSINKDAWWSEWVSRLHGELLLGDFGSAIVELAANWAIVMVVSGLYLWWPRGRGFAGVLWPRFQRGRVLWRDLHAVIGFWISSLVLVLLISGLPWTGIWGDGFKWVRAELGWNGTSQEWNTSRQVKLDAGHSHHDHTVLRSESVGSLAPWVDKANQLRLDHPVIVTPPGGPKRFGRGQETLWTIRSDSQNRTLRTTVYFDETTRQELGRDEFSKQHVIDRAIGYGISWHEGHLFGITNLLIGLLTAVGLATLVVSGTVMWLKRSHLVSGLGAPLSPTETYNLPGWIIVIAIMLMIALPILAVSIVVIVALERLVLSRINAVAVWLGLRQRT